MWGMTPTEALQSVFMTAAGVLNSPALYFRANR